MSPERTLEPGRSTLRWKRALLVAYAAIICWATYLHGIAEQQNIFQIFRWSFFHLRDGADLYAPDPAHHNDLFKYSPTYALLFAPFALPPFPVGLFLWDALNVVLLYAAFGALLPHRQALLVRTLVLLEVYRSTIRSQSNVLLAGLIILAFVALERRRQAAGAASILLGTIVKLFPLGAAAFALFHPGRLRFAGLMLLGAVPLLALPLLVTSPERLVEQYRSWGDILARDAAIPEPTPELLRQETRGSAEIGGVHKQLRIWFGVTWSKGSVALAGLVLLMLPVLARRKAWGDAHFRRLFLCSLLVFAVIFNHKAESPTFVVAVAGIAIWYVTSPPSRLRLAAMILTILFVSLTSEIHVPHLTREVFNRYKVKTLPCVLAWILMQVDLWRLRVPLAGGQAPPAPAPG